MDTKSLYDETWKQMRTVFTLHVPSGFVEPDYNKPVFYNIQGNQLAGNNTSTAYAGQKSYFKPNVIYQMTDIESVVKEQTTTFNQRCFYFTAHELNDPTDSLIFGVRILVIPKGEPETVSIRVFGEFGHRKFGYYMKKANYSLDEFKSNRKHDFDSNNVIRNVQNKCLGKRKCSFRDTSKK